MPDHEVLRLDATLLKDVELFHGRFAGYAGMGENRKVRREMDLRDRAKYFALVIGNLIPTADFAEGAHRLRARLVNKILRNLVSIPRRDFGWIKRLGVEAGAGDDRHAGTLRE